MKKINCKNQIQAYLDKTNSKLCGFSIWFKVGSAYDIKEKQGLAHLVEHLKFTNGKDFERLGMTLHAFTSMDYMEITGSFLSQNYKECLQYIVNTLNSNIGISLTEIKKEIQTILNEKNESLNNIHQKMWQIRNAQLWKGEILANDLFGKKETLNQITPLDIKEFNEKYIQNSKSMSLFFSGNIKKEELENILSQIKIKNSKEFTPAYIEGKTGKNHIVKKFKSNTIGVHVKIKNIQKEDTVKLHIIKELLANNWSSIFVEEMRSKKSETYWVESQSNVFMKDGYLSLSFEPKSKNLEKIVRNIRKILLSLEKYIDKERLIPVKQSYILRILTNNYSPENLCYWYGESYTKDNLLYSPEDYAEKVSNTNLSEILEFAKKIINPESIYSTILKKE